VEVDEQAARDAWNAQQRYLASVAQGLSLMNWPQGEHHGN